MKRMFICFIALILCLSLAGVSALAEEEGCGLGEAVSAHWDEQAAAPQVSVRTESGDVAVSGVQDVMGASNSGSASDLVTRMYRQILGRDPDAAGLKAWVDALKAGQLTAADLVLGFVDSPEYTKSGRSSTQIVTDLYKAMLGREPDEAGLKAWQKYLDVGMTPRVLCAGFVASPEFSALAKQYGILTGDVEINAARDVSYELTYFVYRLYKNCLGRTPDAAGLEDWCDELLYDATGVDAAYGFIFSSECYNQHKGNGEYVAMLYDTILGRKVDEAGYEAWKFVLDYSSTREKVLNGFLFSPEFQAQCAVAGIYLGDKLYEPDNEISWRNNVTLLQLVNTARAERGLPLLKLREDLWSDVAMVRTSEIITRFEHIRPDGRSCFTAWTDAGINYDYAGENIAYGYASALSVFNAWMNSEGHRANILDPDFNDFATGYERYKNTTYWAQAFMTVKNLKK
jgi:uncharacterized protein YkwD